MPQRAVRHGIVAADRFINYQPRRSMGVRIFTVGSTFVSPGRCDLPGRCDEANIGPIAATARRRCQLEACPKPARQPT